MRFSRRSAAALLIVLAQRLDVALDLAQAHAVEDAAGVQVLLGEEADVLDAGLARRLFHRGGECGAVVVQQHLRQRAATAAAGAFATEAALRDGGLEVGRCLGFLGEAVAAEVEIEALVEQVLLVGRLRQHEGQRVLQHGAVGEADHLHGARGVDPLGGRDADAGAARGLEELAKRFGGGHGSPPAAPSRMGRGSSRPEGRGPALALIPAARPPASPSGSAWRSACSPPRCPPRTSAAHSACHAPARCPATPRAAAPARAPSRSSR